MLSLETLRLEEEYVKTKSGIPIAICFEWDDKELTISVSLCLNLCDYLDRMEEYYELAADKKRIDFEIPLPKFEAEDDFYYTYESIKKQYDENERKAKERYGRFYRHKINREIDHIKY